MSMWYSIGNISDYHDEHSSELLSRRRRMRAEAAQMKKELSEVKNKMVETKQKDQYEIQVLRQDLLKTKSKLRGKHGVGTPSTAGGSSLIEDFDSTDSVTTGESAATIRIREDYQRKINDMERNKEKIMHESRQSTESYRREIHRLKDELRDAKLEVQTESQRAHSALRSSSAKSNQDFRKMREDMEIMRRRLRETEHQSDTTVTSLRGEVETLRCESDKLRHDLREAMMREEQLLKSSEEEEKLRNYIRKLQNDLRRMKDEYEAKEMELADEMDKHLAEADRQHDEDMDLMRRKLADAEHQNNNETHYLRDEIEVLRLDADRLRSDLFAAEEREKRLTEVQNEEQQLHEYIRQLKSELDRAEDASKVKEAELNAAMQKQLQESQHFQEKLAEVKQKAADQAKKAAETLDKTLSVALDRNDDLQNKIRLVTREAEEKEAEYAKEIRLMEARHDEEVMRLKEELNEAFLNSDHEKSTAAEAERLQGELESMKQKVSIVQQSKEQALHELREEIRAMRVEAQKLEGEARASRDKAKEDSEHAAFEASQSIFKVSQELASMSNEIQELNEKLLEANAEKMALEGEIVHMTDIHRKEIETLKMDLLCAKKRLESSASESGSVQDEMEGYKRDVEKLNSELSESKKKLEEVEEIRKVVDHGREIEVKQYKMEIELLQRDLQDAKRELEEKERQPTRIENSDDLAAENKCLKEEMEVLKSKLEQAENDLEDEMDNHLKDSDLWMMEMEKVKRKMLGEQERMKQELDDAKRKAREAEEREREERLRMEEEIENAKVKAREEAESVLNVQATALAEKVDKLREKAAYWSKLLKDEKLKAVEEGRRASEALAATEAAALEAVNKSLASPARPTRKSERSMARARSRTGRSSSVPPERPTPVKKKSSWFGTE
eukprot:CAMPEP_0116025584 /NCGR_PEP_ID=MMETSP0321-20121206/13164_1 /TAXON_ID=163516 /ORGANISM="Leptocylindrus danicus var. danicus, Strain B650" /LENGTH=901 /DNA_ID=CAMNT_0003497863 /DNA_START=271 /DNA_END=2976 /DNA_ORIENTATION=-